MRSGRRRRRSFWSRPHQCDLRSKTWSRWPLWRKSVASRRSSTTPGHAAVSKPVGLGNRCRASPSTRAPCAPDIRFAGVPVTHATHSDRRRCASTAADRCRRARHAVLGRVHAVSELLLRRVPNSRKKRCKPLRSAGIRKGTLVLAGESRKARKRTSSKPARQNLASSSNAAEVLNTSTNSADSSFTWPNVSSQPR